MNYFKIFLQWGVRDRKRKWLTSLWRRCLFQSGCYCFPPLRVTSAMNMHWPLSASCRGRGAFIHPRTHRSLCSQTKRRWSLWGARRRLRGHMKVSGVNPFAMACGRLWLPRYATGNAFIGHARLERRGKKSSLGICYNLKKSPGKVREFGTLLSYS